MNPVVLVHDQDVTALEREGDLPGGQLVREFFGCVGVCLIESGLGEQHLGGEPDESEIRGFTVQDWERLVLLAHVRQLEERSVPVCHVGQQGAARRRQARYGRASIGEDAGAGTERVASDAQKRRVVRGLGHVDQVHVKWVVPRTGGQAGIGVEVGPNLLSQRPPLERLERDRHFGENRCGQAQELVPDPQRFGDVPQTHHGVSGTRPV